MLANGATIGYAADAATKPNTFTNIPDLKSFPDLGAEPEMVDNTALTDQIRHNERGIGDPGSMDFEKYNFRRNQKCLFRCLQPPRLKPLQPPRNPRAVR